MVQKREINGGNKPIGFLVKVVTVDMHIMKIKQENFG